MDRTRDQFLARACFTHQKRGGFSRSYPSDVFEDVPDGGALADDLVESALVADLLLQVLVLVGQAILEPFDLRGELRGLDRAGCLRRNRFEGQQGFVGETLAAEDTENTHQFVAKEERTATERANSLATYPCLVWHARIGLHIIDPEQARLGHLAYLQVADGDAVMRAVDVGVQARARGEVKRRVFRRDRRATAFSYAWRAVRSLAVQPDAGERDLAVVTSALVIVRSTSPTSRLMVICVAMRRRTSSCSPAFTGCRSYARGPPALLDARSK